MGYSRAERRRVLAAAALGRAPVHSGPDPADGDPVHAVTGRILDISPHLIIISTPAGAEERLVIAPWATAWRDGNIPPADLAAGTTVIIKTLREGRVVDRIWADITRMTGTILSIGGRKDLAVELDCGPHQGRRDVVIPYRTTGRLRVRHPQLEEGFLFDAIGIREAGTSLALLPATSQPAYRAQAVPTSPPSYGGMQSRISGTATWSDAFDEEEQGAAYPMMERSDTGCTQVGESCADLPYLALGSLLNVRNVCAGRSSWVPIVACGCMAGLFCDRCVECGTSSRGRVAELSKLSFVELGGELTQGCFNARVGLG